MDQIINILKQCFPKADKFRIVENFSIGENQRFVSDVIRLTFEYEEDGLHDSKSLIIKLPKNYEEGSFLNELNVFIKETFMYNTIIPRINSYLDVSLTPAYFKTVNENIICLENVSVYGYETDNDNRIHCNIKQCLAKMKALADFHATSHKVGQLDPQLLHNKILHNIPVYEFKQKMTDFWKPIFIELLARNDAFYLIPKINKVDLQLSTDENDVKSKVDYLSFRFLVINHGDYRNNNTLLKYGQHDEVDGVKIIDFQTCFWSCPIHDFMYFFIISADVESIENHYETLVNWYLECLNEKLKTIDCNEVYTRQNFEEDLKILYFCVIMDVFISALTLCPLDRVQLLDTILHRRKENTRYYMEACLKDQIFRSKILSGLKFCDRIGLLENSQRNKKNTPESQ